MTNVAAIDGDADRCCIAIDEKGNAVDGNLILEGRDKSVLRDMGKNISDVIEKRLIQNTDTTVETANESDII